MKSLKVVLKEGVGVRWRRKRVEGGILLLYRGWRNRITPHQVE
jgi:hypothetical protein